MNLEEFARQAVTIEKAPFGNVDLDQAGALTLRWGFPTPMYGVMLFVNHRGDANNGVDWAADRLRNYLVELIQEVANESIAAVNDVEGLSQENREKIAQSIRKRLGVIVH